MTRFSFFFLSSCKVPFLHVFSLCLLTLRPPGEPLPCSSSVKEEPVARKLEKPGPGAAGLHGI